MCDIARSMKLHAICRICCKIDTHFATTFLQKSNLRGKDLTEILDSV